MRRQSGRHVEGARGEREDGQATVELVAVLPVLGLVVLLAWQAVVAGQTWWLATPPRARRRGRRRWG